MFDQVREQVEESRFYMKWSRRWYSVSPRRHAQRWYERARQGYSIEDTFDFDGYLAKVIAGGVADIRSVLHGHPAHLQAPNDPTGEKALEVWGSILDKIVEGFTIYAEEGGYPPPVGDGEPRANAVAAAKAAKIDEAKKLFIEWFGHLWD